MLHFLIFFNPISHIHFPRTSFVVFIISIAWSITLSESGTEMRTDNSQIGYYLQLYNSINSYRSKHTVPALKWNRTLTETAEYFAVRIITVPDSFDIGEAEGINLFVTPGQIRPSVNFVSGNWYNESAHYDYNRPGYSPSTQNFTQMVWKSSTSVGIGTFTSNNYTSVVAKFYPEGNARGKFRQNVIPVYKRM